VKLAIAETAPYGGLLHYAFQLADALARRGNEVDLIAARDNELSKHSSAARMVDVLTPPVHARPVRPPGRVRYVLKRAGVAARLVRAWFRIVVVSRRGGYDAVVINCPIQMTVIAAIVVLLNRLPGGPPIAHICHDSRAFSQSANKLFKSGAVLNRVLRAAYSGFDLVLVHGERSRRDFEAAWGRRRMAIIPHGDERIFGGDPPPPTEEERILFFGNWAVVKGIPVLMQAFDRIASRRPEARLTLAGSPNPQEVDVDEIRRWAAERAEVELIDRYVPLADVPGVFGSARVIAVPYLVGFQSGIVHLAMTMGRAVVASDVGDIGSVVVDGKTGILVPAGDPEALADALERVISNPPLAEGLGAVGRRGVRTASSGQTVAQRLEAARRDAINPLHRSGADTPPSSPNSRG
jgi:glycosyltransferase involved in cell wall biosynthesis